MDTLTADKQFVIKAYAATDAKGKQLLETVFDKNTFLSKVTDRIKTFDDACLAIGVTGNPLPRVDGCEKKDEDAIIAFAKLSIIARALNEGWEPDWDNSNEYKYYPWFTMKAGFGLSLDGVYFANTDSGVGSRLCFKTRELALYAGEQFKALYCDYLTIHS